MYWLRDIAGEIPLDFIGRFENLESEFAHVGEHLGLDHPQLPKLVSGGNSPSCDEVYDDRTRALVRKRYEEEIEYFDFEFKNA
jgi:hypothetical protein